MLLTSVESVRQRKGEQNIDEVIKALANAVNGATIHLNTVLRTDFAYQTHTETYRVDTTHSSYQDNFVRLYTKQGFIDTSATLEVRVADTLQSVASATPVPSEYVKVVPEKGIIMLEDEGEVPALEDNPFVELTYSAGFQTTTTQNGDLANNVPDWLKEAAVLVASNLYEDRDPVSASIFMFLERYVRYFPHTLKALDNA